MIVRDYHKEFWLMPKVSSGDSIISQRALTLGRVKLRAIIKTL